MRVKVIVHAWVGADSFLEHQDAVVGGVVGEIVCNHASRTSTTNDYIIKDTAVAVVVIGTNSGSLIQIQSSLIKFSLALFARTIEGMYGKVVPWAELQFQEIQSSL